MAGKHSSAKAGKRETAGKKQVILLIQQQQWQAASALGKQLCQSSPNDPECWFLLGAIYGQLQNYPEAVKACQRATVLQPGAAIAHYNLGIALLRLGDYQAAISSLREALRLDPNQVGIHHDLGSACQAAGQLQDAVKHYLKALQYRPTSSPTHYNLALAYRALGDTQKAGQHALRILAQEPAHADAHLLIADMALAQAQYTTASQHYRECLRLQPQRMEALANLGNALLELGDYPGAIEQLTAARQLDPGRAELHFNLGNALRADDRLDDAIQSFQRALALQPTFERALNNCGLIYQQRGDFPAASEYYRRAIDSNPMQAHPWLNLAKIAREELRLEDAIEILDQAIAKLDSTAELHWERAMILLLLEDYARGWEEYEWRWRGGKGIVQRPYRYQTWAGEDLTGKTLLIYAEQGIGDELMFASCFKEMLSRAAHVYIDAAPRLAPLFQRSFPEATLHGCEQAAANSWLMDADQVHYQIAAGSLPRLLRQSGGDFPAHSGYLVPDSSTKARWRDRYTQLGSGLMVGISWRGGHIDYEARKRSTTLRQWLDILRIPGIHWINLQYGKTEDELRHLREQYGITVHDWEDADPLKDLDNFAAQIAALDLVVSIDNSTVHMAGAIGTETWVLQPYSPDWRWGRVRTDCAWYPNLQQIRQPDRDDWPSVFTTLARKLSDRINTSTNASLQN